MDEPFDRLKQARLRAGYANATDAARAFGWNEITYRAHESGGRGLKPKVAEQYARAFKVRTSWLLTGEDPASGAAASGRQPLSPHMPNVDLSKAEEAPPLHRFGGPRSVEVRGTAVGGGEGDGDFRFNGQVIDMAPRPPGIANRRDVYALYVENDSMYPRFDPGARLYVDPHRKPRPGDDVVIELHPEEEGGAGPGYIKKLVRVTPTRVVVEQFNPPKQLEFEIARVKSLHRVIPLDELLGI